MSDQSATEGQPPEAPPTEQTQEQGPPEWLNPINERMDELSESTRNLAEQLAAQQTAQSTAPEGLDELDYYDEAGDLTPEGAQALIDQRVDERLQSVLSERDAASALDEREGAFEALREEIPAFKDDKLASRLVRETADYLRDQGRADVIETPMFVDLIEDRYYREQHHERVSTEREQQAEQQVVLESASGASQPSGDGEPDWGERIVKAAERLRPQI